MSREMKKYTFKHVIFPRRELTHSEERKVRALLRESFKDTDFLRESFIDLIGRFDESGIVEKIFPIIFRPYNPNIFYRMWNSFWIKRHHIDLKEVIQDMPKPLVDEVIMDFFLTDLKWANELANVGRTFSMSGSGTIISDLLRGMEKVRGN
jgi:hypothetical protein